MSVQFGFPYRRTPRFGGNGALLSWAVDESSRVVPDRAGGATRAYPFDQWDVPPALLERAKRLCILKVPLLGQNFGVRGNGWCGRTSASMMYNWFKLVSSDEPKSAYITQWVGKQGGPLDLRLPSGEVAFDGYQLQAELKDFPRAEGCLLPSLDPADASARADEVRRLLVDNDYLLAKLRSSGLLTAIDQRNPALLCTGFAGRPYDRNGLQHIVLAIGYFIIEESGRDELFIVIADPAMPPGAKNSFGLGDPIAPQEPDDSRVIGELKPIHNYLRLLASGDDWTKARGTVSAIRARALFRPHPFATKPGGLLIDHGTRPGGFFFHKQTPTPNVPPELVVETSSSVSLPFDERTVRGSPQRYFFLNEKLSSGYFPLGQHQNIHTGVHLLATASPAAAAASDTVPVRALAPGYVVALRLPGFPHLPDPQGASPGGEGQGDEEDIEPNELSRQLTGSDNGFVLIRHEIEKPRERGQPEERRVFYSLSMHLRAPKFSPSAEGFEHDIDWLARLVQRFGSVTVLDPRSPRFRERRWLAPSQDVTGKLSRGGKYPVYTDDLGRIETINLDPESESESESNQKHRPLTFVREPELELKEAYRRLQANEVVTFKVPFLRVQAGDVVGVIGRQSHFGRGFLHWEVLTPGEGSMKDLIGFLNGRLPEDARLPEDLFKETDESVEDNFFEDEELKSVIDSLPSCDKSQGERLSPHNPGRSLVRYMKSKPGEDDTQLAFDTSAKGKGFFSSQLRITNHGDLVPAKSYPLTLTSSGGAFDHEATVTYDGARGTKSIPIEIPAGTTRLRIKAGDDLFVDAGTTGATVAEQAKFFKSLVAARWRNTVIRHLNEWSMAGLKKTLETRLGAGQTIRPEWRPKGKGASDEEIPVDDYVKAVAWWGENGGGKEHHALFAEPAGEGQLPSATRVENMHPVTLAWLLRLVEDARVAKLIRHGSWHGADAEKAAYLGWSPEIVAQPRHRVGEAMMFIAVQKQEPAGDAEVPVRVELEQDGKRIVLGDGKYIRGLYAELATGQFWGKVKLGIAGQSPVPGLIVPSNDDAPAEGGSTGGGSGNDAQTIELAAPELAADLRPLLVGRDDRGVARLSFKKDCPVRLMGWVVFKSEGGKVSNPKTSLPITAEEAMPWAASAKVKVENGEITSCADGASLSKDFAYSEYRTAAKPNGPRVFVALVRAVQGLRDNTEGRGMSLGNLAADGASIELTLANRVLGPKTVEPMKTLWSFYDGWLGGAKATAKALGAELEPVEVPEAERGRKRPVVKLVDLRDGSAGGDLGLSFAVEDAQAAAEELSGPKDSVAKLQVGFRFFNGLAPQEAHQEMDWSAIGGKAFGGPVDAWTSGALEIPLAPRIGSPTFSLVENTGLGRVTVEFLGGDQRFWNTAKPSIDVPAGLPRGATPEPMKPVLGSVARWQMTYTFPMAVKGFRDKLTFHGKAKGDTIFRGKKLSELSGDKLEYNNKEPRAKWAEPPRSHDNASEATKTLAAHEDTVSVEIETVGVPADVALEISLVNPAQSGELVVAYARSKQLRVGGQWRLVGFVDAKGVFKASLVVTSLREYAEGGTIEVRVSWDGVTAFAKLDLQFPTPEAPKPRPTREEEPPAMDDIHP